MRRKGRSKEETTHASMRPRRAVRIPGEPVLGSTQPCTHGPSQLLTIPVYTSATIVLCYAPSHACD